MSDEATGEYRMPAPPRLGTLLAGRYRLEQRVGRGGMADVFRARDERLQRDVAIKLFRMDLDDDPATDRRRVEAEMHTLASLRHPNLVTLHDASTGDEASDHAPYLVMEYVAGRTLRAELAQAGALPPQRVAVLGTRLAQALHHVHANGLVHRDLKPANILLEDDDPEAVKLTDFGIAQLVDGTRITAHGTTVGTANYLSPEQAQGLKLDPSSDVFSLGIVLIECLTGAMAFPGVGVEAALARLHRAPAIPDGVGAPWSGLLAAMTARDPAQRPAAAAVVAALGGRVEPGPATAATSVLPATPPAGSTARLPAAPPNATSPFPVSGSPVSGSPADGSPDGGRDRSRRRRLVPVLLAVLLVAALAVVLGIVLGSGSDAPSAAPSGPPSAATGRPTATGSPSTTAYPSVDGRLGEDLRALEESLPGSGRAADQLSADVRAVARAAHYSHLATARQALSTLRTDLAAAAAAGSVGSDRVAAIRAAAARVSADLGSGTSPSPSIVVRTTTAPTARSTTPATSGKSKKSDAKGPAGNGHSGPGGPGGPGNGPGAGSAPGKP